MHITKLIKEDWLLYLIFTVVLLVVLNKSAEHHNIVRIVSYDSTSVKNRWVAPSIYLDNALEGENRNLVLYGQDLVANTSKYLGPKGTVLQITNGMNCQNCHLDAGSREWGNNYSAVQSTYPKFRDRSGTVETVEKRVNDCFERSLNGKTIDSSGKEMIAIKSYIHWLGKEVKKGKIPIGAGITQLQYLDRPASPDKGKLVFAARCQSCHGANGQGQFDTSGKSYQYPPLWGDHSYNNGAGLFRLSRLAGYVRDNMPFNQSTHANPVLTDTESWDVAAYINSQPRPYKDLSKDWPDISKKPVDHPYGPYTDGFTETQHKFGPFKPILEARKKQKENPGK